MTTFNNKWTHGEAFFSLPPLPPELRRAEGILPFNLALDPEVGTETVLLLIERTPFVFQLAKVIPFNFRLKAGLFRTANGPLLFLLFFVLDPRNPNAVFTAIDAHVNPLDPQHMLMWRDLARQSHWHLILVDANDELVDLFEFPNTFVLSQTLGLAEEACMNMRGGRFDEAKAEFSAMYSIEDLLQME